MDLFASHYSGCGNDFFLLDNREGQLPALGSTLIQKMCQTKSGIDGLILVGSSRSADIAMKYYNSDGHEAEMCGNGVRCLMQFLRQKLHYPRTKCLLETKKREILVRCVDEEIVVHIGKVEELDWELPLDSYVLYHVDTGVPHVVILVPDVETIDVEKLGKHFRLHPHFQPRGTNVNFVSGTSPIQIRTFERGVEKETLACGTGVCAAAFVLQKLQQLASPIDFQVRSKEMLQVSFECKNDHIHNMALKGPARWISDHIFSVDLEQMHVCISNR